MTTKTSTFGAFAEDYDRYRPDYPESLWDHLGLEKGAHVADLGAGTGRASAGLAGCGFRVTAVEPDPGMVVIARAQAARHGAAFSVVEAPAERTGLGTESQDAVVAAQSYHWFDPQEANREVSRILRTGGPFLVVWNDREVEGVDWLEAFEDLIVHYNPEHRREYRMSAADRLATGDIFGEVEEIEIDHPWEVDREGFLGYARSISYIRNAVTPTDLGRFEAELSKLLREAHGDDRFEVPMKTRAYLTRAE